MANESAIVRSALYKTLQTTLTTTNKILLFTNNSAIFNLTIYIASAELNAKIDITTNSANIFIDTSSINGSVVVKNNKYYLQTSSNITNPIVKKDINSIDDITKIDFTSAVSSDNTTDAKILLSFVSNKTVQFGSGVVFNNDLVFNNDVNINKITSANNISISSANVNVNNTLETKNLTVTQDNNNCGGSITAHTANVTNEITTKDLDVSGTATFENIFVDGNSTNSKITIGAGDAKHDITGLATGAFKTTFSPTTDLTKIYVAFPFNTIRERYKTATNTDKKSFTLMAGKVGNDDFELTYTDGTDLVLLIGSNSFILGTTPSNYEGKFIYNTNSYTLNNNQQELSITRVLTESFVEKTEYDRTSIVKLLNTTLVDDNKNSTLVTANALDEALAIIGQASISTISSLNANYENNDNVKEAHLLTQESATSTKVNNNVGIDENGKYVNLNGTKIYNEATADQLGPVKVAYNNSTKVLTISTK